MKIKLDGLALLQGRKISELTFLERGSGNRYQKISAELAEQRLGEMLEHSDCQSEGGSQLNRFSVEIKSKGGDEELHFVDQFNLQARYENHDPIFLDMGYMKRR